MILTYCNKNKFNYVYHPFTCNSATFEDVLQFKRLHQYNYKNIVKTVDKVITINDLRKVRRSSNEKNMVQHLTDMHTSSERILLFDNIHDCGNYPDVLSFNITANDIIETKKQHRGCLLPYYTNVVATDYICIHIRCGDVRNDASRYLSVSYFIDKYKYLITKFPDLKELPVYVVTESNFADDTILKEQLAGCTIVKTDATTSFYYLVNSTYLVASRSGFSNLAYILGNMKVLKPPHDWNSYWDNVIE